MLPVYCQYQTGLKVHLLEGRRGPTRGALQAVLQRDVTLNPEGRDFVIEDLLRSKIKGRGDYGSCPKSFTEGCFEVLARRCQTVFQEFVEGYSRGCQGLFLKFVGKCSRRR